MSKKLAIILTNVEIDFDIEKMKFKGFHKNLKDFLAKYQIDSLIKRIFEKKTSSKKAVKKEQNQMGLF